ncbi:MAG: PQQ-binding-like beta-propeller repeat protein [Pirellulaceae bacterium]|nr:PQQ-binding-like beta-propeller repeat protein [Pirellulaceae bacterium]
MSGAWKWSVWLLAGLAFGSLVWVGGQSLAQVKAKPKVKGKTATTNLAEEEAKRGEWSRWRGPNGDGISLETGLLDEWPSDGPPLAWRVKGLGSGYASISVAGGKIFTLGKKQGRTNLIARSVADGAPIWETAVGGGGNPNCTPTVDGDLVFGLTLGGDLFCCQASDGALVWSKNYERDFGGKMMSSWGYSESPLIDGDKLVCTPGGDSALLAALDKKTGNTIWTTQVRQADIGRKGQDGAGYASVVIGNCGGVKQYITLVGRGIVSVEAESGKPLWSYNGVANGTANIPTPIVAGDYVFCSSGYGTGTALLKINGGRSGFSAQEVYFLSANKMQNHHGGMIQKDGYVYCGTGHNEGFPLCIAGPTGADAWRPGRGPGSGSAAIAYADGHLYFRYEDATMALIEATPKEFKLKGQFRIASRNDKSWPHPVIAGGKLYLRDQDELLCYDIRKQ